jgi:hypothetical protein
MRRFSPNILHTREKPVFLDMVNYTGEQEVFANRSKSRHGGEG